MRAIENLVSTDCYLVLGPKGTGRHARGVKVLRMSQTRPLSPAGILVHLKISLPESVLQGIEVDLNIPASAVGTINVEALGNDDDVREDV